VRLRTGLAVAALMIGIQSVWGQAVSPQMPAFEVASVKPNESDGTPTVGFQASGRFIASRASVRELIRLAYGAAGILEASRVIGGPGWTDTDRFDVVAKAADGTPQPLMLVMLHAVLTDRFKLKLHGEKRELPNYELVMARSDRKLDHDFDRSHRTATRSTHEFRRSSRTSTLWVIGRPCRVTA
jgi:uncharacterized protein (TIGR03435 family)